MVSAVVVPVVAQLLHYLLRRAADKLWSGHRWLLQYKLLDDNGVVPHVLTGHPSSMLDPNA